MYTVLIALADVGTAIQVEENLTKLGVPVRWDGAVARGPTAGNPAGEDVVLVSAAELGGRLADVASAWRQQAHSPAWSRSAGRRRARPPLPRAARWCR
ncbi:MAG: hypothetical protein R2939_06560 [Kofleriaceae bacterium]